MHDEQYEPATLDELRGAVTNGRERKAREIDGVPLELLALLLGVLDAADTAAELLEDGKAAAARRRLNKALNALPARV